MATVEALKERKDIELMKTVLACHGDGGLTCQRSYDTIGTRWYTCQGKPERRVEAEYITYY